LFYGCGVLSGQFGLLPKRHPITTVFGAPIHVEKSVNPTTEEVDRLHARYTKALVELFNEHKNKFGLSDSDRLVIV
jgi:hypothetical protein